MFTHNFSICIHKNNTFLSECVIFVNYCYSDTVDASDTSLTASTALLNVPKYSSFVISILDVSD